MSNSKELSKRMWLKANGSYKSALNDSTSELTLNRAVSSLYYACFQALTAIMILRSVESSTHKFARQYLNKVLVMQENFPIDLAKLYNRLMDDRNKADYDPMSEFDINHVSELIKNVELFLIEASKRLDLEDSTLESKSFIK